MDSNYKFWLGVWITVMLGICLLTATIAGGIIYDDYLFVKGGYTRQTLQGNSMAQWIKDCNCPSK